MDSTNYLYPDSAINYFFYLFIAGQRIITDSVRRCFRGKNPEMKQPPPHKRKGGMKRKFAFHAALDIDWFCLYDSGKRIRFRP